MIGIPKSSAILSDSGSENIFTLVPSHQKHTDYMEVNAVMFFMHLASGFEMNRTCSFMLVFNALANPYTQRRLFNYLYTRRVPFRRPPAPQSTLVYGRVYWLIIWPDRRHTTENIGKQIGKIHKYSETRETLLDRWIRRFDHF